MPFPLPEGQQIQVTYKKFAAQYKMPSLQAASDHYSLAYLLSGDRMAITTTMNFPLHQGYVGAIPPYVYHRTIPASNQIYERILIKFKPEFVKPLTDQFGIQFLDSIYENPSHHFSPEYQGKMEELFREMLSEYEEASPYRDFQLQCILSRILILLHTHSLQNEDSKIHTTPISPQIIEAIYYMERNFAKPLTIDDVAKISGYSTAYFSRLFQSQIGKSYTEYLLSIRIRHIQNLLLNSDYSITDIALETGFKYPGNMTMVFKQKTGLTPLQFRKKSRETG